ncbi:MAG: universal stress protein [Acidobacteriota bacterium]
MFPVRKILCPTDFSDCSYEALRIAAEIASQFGAQLYLLHVLPDMPNPLWTSLLDDARAKFEPGLSEYEKALRDAAQRKLAEVIAERIPGSVESHAALSKGDAATEIARVAESERAALIIMSTHGMRGWRQVALGSVAERVVRLSSRPVLTVRAPDVR